MFLVEFFQMRSNRLESFFFYSISLSVSLKLFGAPTIDRNCISPNDISSTEEDCLGRRLFARIGSLTIDLEQE